MSLIASEMGNSSTLTVCPCFCHIPSLCTLPPVCMCKCGIKLDIPNIDNKFQDHLNHIAEVSIKVEELRSEFRTFYVERFKELEKKMEERHVRQVDENRKISRLIEDINLRPGLQVRNPFKCPVCSGYGGSVISGVIDEDCYPCKATGIVWG